MSVAAVEWTNISAMAVIVSIASGGVVWTVRSMRQAIVNIVADHTVREEEKAKEAVLLIAELRGEVNHLSDMLVGHIDQLSAFEAATDTRLINLERRR